MLKIIGLDKQLANNHCNDNAHIFCFGMKRMRWMNESFFLILLFFSVSHSAQRLVYKLKTRDSFMRCPKILLFIKKIAYCSNNNTWATSQLRSVCESHSRILDLQSSRRGKQNTGHSESPILNLIHPTTIQWVQASKACHVHTSILSLMYLRASAVPISSSSGIVTNSNFSLGLQTLVRIWWNCVTAESSTIMIISEKESTCH